MAMIVLAALAFMLWLLQVLVASAIVWVAYGWIAPTFQGPPLAYWQVLAVICAMKVVLGSCLGKGS